MKLAVPHTLVGELLVKSGVLTLPFCLMLVCTEGLFGQAETGRITGTVTDATGAVVPGAGVILIAVGTNRRIELNSNEDGRYSSGPLQVGAYRIEAQATGFKRLIHDSITLEVQQTALVNLRLELGEVTEQVTVTGGAAMIQTTEASQGQVIEERRVKDLPLNGRDYMQLALLSEGVVEPPGQGRTATGANGGGASRAGGYSAGGQRSTDNNYLLDGFDNNTNDTSFDNNQAEAVKPSVDAIQEFKVQANGYSAEFGRAAGGVVNLTLKSGTNQIHGTAYNFLRNEKLDARNFFDGARVPPFKRNNYGYSAGGPAIKNKLFLFLADEWLDRRESRTANNTLPTLRMRRGDFGELANPIFDPQTFDRTTNTRQSFPGNVIPASRFDPVSRSLIDFYPQPLNSSLSQNFLFNPPDADDVHRVNTRTDFHATPKDQFSWMLNHQAQVLNSRANLPAPAFGGTSRVTDVWSWSTGLTWTRVVTQSFFTTVKAGWVSNKFLIDFAPEAKALGDVNAQIGLSLPNSGLDVRYPNINLSGFTSLGAGNFLPVTSNGQARQLKVDNTWIKGSHNLKFGIDFQWIQTNNLNSRERGGVFSFSNRYTRNPLNNQGGSPVADFLLGQVDSSNISTSTRIDGRARLLAGYLQDTWHLNQRLTLDLGMRYDFMRPFESKFDQLATVDFRPGSPDTRILLSSATMPRSLVHPDGNNVQPRVGLAFQLVPEKVVLRAGYGIFYAMQRFSPFGDSSSIVVNPPYNVAVTTTSDGITPASILRNGIPADALVLRNARSVALASTELRPKLGNAQHWNLNLQMQPARDWMLQVGYFAAKGTHLVQIVEGNEVESLGPGNINARRRFKSVFVPLSLPGAAGPVEGTVISPLGSIVRQENKGNSIYHSFQAKIERRFSQFTLLGSWMWSSSIGDLLGGNPSGVAPASGFQNPNDLRGERGLLDTHLAHRVVTSGIWELPFGKGAAFANDMNPVLNKIVRGWSATGIMTLTTGRPYTLSVQGNPANSSSVNRPDVVGDPYALPGGPSVAQFFNRAAFRANQPFTYGNLGRNALIGPAFQNADFSLMKRETIFSASDRPIDVQFRWELFNVLNHANFGFPGTTLGTPTYGQLTNSSPARKMQFGLKLIF